MQSDRIESMSDGALLDHLRSRTSVRFFFDPRAVSARAANIARSLPRSVKKVIARADSVLAGKFPIADEWEPFFGVQLPRRDGGTFSWYDPPIADPEFTCVLNRHRFWIDLAMAYRFTQKPRYSEELIRQIESWCDQTPPLADPHQWQITRPRWHLLDAAVRLDTWPWVLFLMLDSDAWTPEINALFVRRLWDHGHFVAPLVPETGGNNWVIMESQGLANLSILFPELEQSATWENLAQKTLSRCMAEQFRADGGHFEQAPAYHDGCILWLLEPLHLARLNQRTWTHVMWERLRGICEWQYQMMEPNGTLPGFSDSSRDSVGVLTEAGLLLGEPKWTQFRKPGLREAWMIDEVSNPTAPRKAAASFAIAPRPQAVALRESGYYILRDGDDSNPRTAIQLIIDAGPHGGWHGHFDLLSFDLWAFGRPQICDPGIPIYTEGPERSKYTGTPLHNTISIDGLNHDVAPEPGSPIAGTPGVEAKVVEWSQSETAHIFSAWHNGYSRLPGQPRVGRTIWFDRRSRFLVADWGVSEEEHQFTTSFMLAWSKLLRLDDDSLHTRHLGGNVRVSQVFHDPSIKNSLEYSSWMPRYQVGRLAPRITFTQHGRRFIFVTFIQVFPTSNYSKGAVPIPQCRVEADRAIITFEDTNEIVELLCPIP